jgi:hypothetical protein
MKFLNSLMKDDGFYHGRMAILFSALALVTQIAGIGVSGCAGWKQEAKTVLDIATYECINANSTAPVQQIKDICKIANDLLPALYTILQDLAARDAKVIAQHEADVRVDMMKATPSPAGKK